VADSIAGFDAHEYLVPSDAVLDTAEAREDERLVEALREGVEDAYEALIQRFQQPVYNLVARLLSSRTDPSDVVQEVFLKIFRSIHQFRGQSSLKTWIYRIAVNEAYNQRRWFRRHQQQEVELENDDDRTRSYADILPDPHASPYDYVLDREQHVLIERALETVNPSFRAAVVLRDLEDLSYEEIADILQISMGTVKSRILRGREALRKQLAERFEQHSSNAWSAQPVE
jgi:RNA polymerase sigma-70 factor, ECF subfamily